MRHRAISKLNRQVDEWQKLKSRKMRTPTISKRKAKAANRADMAQFPAEEECVSMSAH